ncbi:MAG: hypothetical protein H0U27_09965 [Nitrosopumilus sp.]|nr:hypothetical protein [Nitrosopumilus sp.]MBA3550855.1 hypothetical protein [Patescibacteria group bacterium]
MTTITSVNYSRTAAISHNALSHYNKYAVLSMIFAALFISYFIIPHEGLFSAIFRFNVFFIVFVPFIALMFSIVSLRQISHNHDKGMTLSYVALGISGLYFMVALAIPVVLVGLYLIYTFVI